MPGDTVIFTALLIFGVLLVFIAPAVAVLVTRGTQRSVAAQTVINEAGAALVLSISAFKLGFLSVALSRSIGIGAFVVIVVTFFWEVAHQFQRKRAGERMGSTTNDDSA